jgi:hypothetical protein
MSTDAPQTPKVAKDSPPFESAAEQPAVSVSEESWDNEGGHLSSHFGRIVYTAGDHLPYKVVLSHDGTRETARRFPSMREAEAFIRRNTPLSRPPLSKLYDRDAGDA